MNVCDYTHGNGVSLSTQIKHIIDLIAFLEFSQQITRECLASQDKVATKSIANVSDVLPLKRGKKTRNLNFASR